MADVSAIHLPNAHLPPTTIDTNKAAVLSQTNRLTKLEPRGRWQKHLRSLIAKILAISFMLAATGLGGRATITYIREFQALGSNVTIDLQLAGIGVLNKIMDVLVTTSLEATAAVWVSKTIYRSEIRLADFELGQELTKPWKSIGAFIGCWQAQGGRVAGKRRFLVTLSCSTCLMFLGLATNTVGIPKERWWPDAWNAPQHRYPRPEFQSNGLDWNNFETQAISIVGDQSPARIELVANGLTTASLLSSFSFLKSTFSMSPQGWYMISDQSGTSTAMDTRLNNSVSRGFAARSTASDMLQEYLINDPSLPNAKGADALLGLLDMAWPSTAVSCSASDITFPPISTNGSASILVQPSSSPRDSSSVLDLTLRPFEGFPGCRCEVSFMIVAFETFTNIAESNSQGAGLSIQKVDTPARVLPTRPVNVAIASQLTKQLISVIPALDRTLQSGTDGTAAQFLVATARNLGSYRPEYDSDPHSLAPVMALLTNRLLGIARWNLTMSTTDYTVARIPQFHVVGCGPRLLWEWAASLIFAPLLIACIFGLFQIVCYRIVPGEWMKPSGMIAAAYNSQHLDDVGAAKNDQELAELQLAIRSRDDSTVCLVAHRRVNGPLPDAVDLKGAYRWGR